MPPSVAVHISTVQDLHRFNDDAEADAAVAKAVTDLTIELAGPIPVAALRRCLRMVTNVADLVLLLPFDTPAHFLSEVPLPNLELLKTNLPHRHLVPFLAFIPCLFVLSIDACGRNANDHVCPLSGANLNHVVTIECPAGCASHVARRGAVRLSATDRPSVVGIPQALKSFPAPSLLYLCLDFFPDDYDILQGIVSAMPWLMKLKLVEKHRTMRRQCHARRAWNDVANWSRWLLKLPYLEEFVLRTAAAFVRSPGNLDQEARTLLRWTESPKRAAIQRRHPTLNLVRVWYRCRDPGNGVITHWSKFTGAWQNTLLMRDPLQNTMF